MRTTVKKPAHLKALLKKNWIIWKRENAACCEILFPLLFVLGMAIIHSTGDKNLSNISYLKDPKYHYQFNSTFNATDMDALKSCSISNGSAVIGLAPEGDSLVMELKNIFETKAGLKTRLFNDLNEINFLTSRSDYGSSPEKTLCSAVIISKNNVDDKYEYTLLFNTTTSRKGDIPKVGPVRFEENKRINLNISAKYAKSGFLAIQNTIDNLILQTTTENPNATILASITPQIENGWERQRPVFFMKPQMLIGIIIPLLIPLLFVCVTIMDDLKNRIAVSRGTFYLSWFIPHLISFTILSIFSTLILCYSYFPLSSFWYIFLWYWEFTIWLIIVAIFCVIASERIHRVFPLTLAFVAFIALIMNISVFDCDFKDQTVFEILLIFLYPPILLYISADHMVILEIAQIGVNSETINLEISNYKLIYYYIMTFVDIIIVLIACICLEKWQQLSQCQGLSSIFSTKKRSFSRGESEETREKKGFLLELTSPEHVQDIEPTLSLQEGQAENSIHVRNLTKKDTKGKFIVNNVSFTMQKNQIFALLGPRDEGKEVIVSMIIGNESPTEGKIEIFGMNYKTDRNKIQELVSENAPYIWELTVKQNFEFFATFKGIIDQDISQEIETIMKDFELFDKRDKLPKDLFEEDLIKLFLSLAFIGQPKFVILKGLGSGLSLSERKNIWNIIKKYKDDRVILLDIEEAEEAYSLADMICVIAEGTVQEIGEPLALQAKYQGYRLSVMKRGFNTLSQPIIDVVFNHIGEGQVLSDTSYKITFQLPEASSSRLQDLFDELDTRKEELKISHFGIRPSAIGNVLLKSSPSNEHPILDDSLASVRDDEVDNFDLEEERIQNGWRLCWTQFKAIFFKNISNTKRDPGCQFGQFYAPIILIIIGTLLSKLQMNSASPSLSLFDDIYGQKLEVNYDANELSLDSDFISKFSPDDFQMTPKITKDIVEFDQAISSPALIPNTSVFNFYMDVFNKTSNTYKYTAFTNPKAQEASPFAMNKMNNAILKSATRNSRKEITVTIASFQMTQSIEFYGTSDGHGGFQIAVLLAMSFFFNFIIESILSEKELEVRYQQTLASVSATTYCLANYFADIFKYLIVAVLCCLLMTALGVIYITDEHKLRALWAIFISFGFSATSFAHLFSLNFSRDKHWKSIWFIFIPSLLALNFFPTLAILEDLEPFGSILKWISKITPFSINSSLYILYNLDMISAETGFNGINSVLEDIITWIIGAIIYLVLLLWIEYRKEQNSTVAQHTREGNQTDAIKVDSLRKVYPYSDTYSHLYSKNNGIDVESVSFNVKNGQCFAIVGLWKTGKTSICEILAGNMIQTSGTVQINKSSRSDIGYCPQGNPLLEYFTVKEHLDFYATIKGIPKQMRERLVAKHLHELRLGDLKHVLIKNISADNKRKLSLATALIGNPSILILDDPSNKADAQGRADIHNAISRALRRKKPPAIVLATESIQEAESLATEIGVIKKGSFEVVGPTQQIKDKFSSLSFDIEVKVNQPSEEEIEATILRLGSFSDQRINRERVNEMLDQLGLTDFSRENGTWSPHRDLEYKDNASTTSVVEWALIVQNGQKLKEFLKENFAEVTMWGPLYPTSLLFQVTSDTSFGNVFELLKANKALFNIKQYSLQETSLEKKFYRSANLGSNCLHDFERYETRYDPVRIFWTGRSISRYGMEISYL